MVGITARSNHTLPLRNGNTAQGREIRAELLVSYCCYVSAAAAVIALAVVVLILIFVFFFFRSFLIQFDLVFGFRFVYVNIGEACLR